MSRQIACDLCSSKDGITIFYTKGYPIVRCQACGLIYANPQPLPEDILPYYEKHIKWGGESQCNTEKLTHLLYSQVLRMLPDGGEVLDIGCSFGLFLRELQRTGHHATGIEINAAAAKVARERGFKVYEQPLGDYIEPEFFDVVTMLNVVEHLNSPLAACQEIWRMLKTGGMIILVTPNTNFVLPLLRAYVKLTGNSDITSAPPIRMSQIYPPDHLYFYTPATLKILMSRAGFKFCRVKNAAPILNNAKRFRTLAKVGVYGLNLLGFWSTFGRWAGSNSILGWGIKKP